MATTEAILQTITVPSGSDFTAAASQFIAVKIDTSGNAVVATAAKACDGILQNKPNSTQAASVAISGVSKAVAGGDITVGQNLELASGGKMVPVASGIIVAKALTAAADGNIVTVLLRPSNGLYA